MVTCQITTGASRYHRRLMMNTLLQGSTPTCCERAEVPGRAEMINKSVSQVGLSANAMQTDMQLYLHVLRSSVHFEAPSGIATCTKTPAAFRDSIAYARFFLSSSSHDVGLLSSKRFGISL